MLEGYLDWLDEAGVVHGWARDRGSERPLCIEVHAGDRPIASAVADEFRGDLFKDRVGHGHYGFRAQVSQAGSIQSSLRLVDLGTSTLLSDDETRIFVSHQGGRRSHTTVEAVIRGGAEWEEGDLYEHVGIFRLERHLGRMHPIRFLDCVYQFLMGRWSDDRDRAEYLTPLRDGTLHPDHLFRAVLTSHERRNNGLPLVGPFDYRFPFDLLETFGDPAP